MRPAAKGLCWHSSICCSKPVVEVKEVPMKKLFVPMALVLSCIAFGAQAADCDAKAARRNWPCRQDQFREEVRKDSAAASAGAM